MVTLNFPEYQFHRIEKEGKLLIFDPVRKKYVVLTPEEWVRQHVIRFLVQEKQVPLTLISVEVEFRLFNTVKRFDLAVSDRNGQALLMVECKAPTVALSQQVLDQAVRYNMTLKVGLLLLTNGLQHVYCTVDQVDGTVRQIAELPVYPFSALNLQN
jgi:hypothetical protein